MVAPPRISGSALRQLARFGRTKVGALAVNRIFTTDLRITELRALPDERFGEVPIDNRALQARPPRAGDGASLGVPSGLSGGGPWSGTSESFAHAFRSKRATPREIAERAIAEARKLAARTPSIGPLLEYADEQARRDAEASTARWRAGKPLGPLDGVPCAIKEQTAVRGMRCQGGTDLYDAAPAQDDATIVARLRDAGAIIVGTTMMTELGMTPLGYNPKRPMPKNPHAHDRVAGGSSTGSGVAVATGVVPFAIGADGGGSIRIPSSLSGVFGIKPTWGRVSRHGDLFGGTVAHIGPLASSVLDLARVLEAIGAHDPNDPQTDHAPPTGSLERALTRGVRGLRIGVCDYEWSGAADPVTRAGREALRALEKEGAVLVEVRPKLVRWAAAIGYLTIGLECVAGERARIRDRYADYNPDLQLTFAALMELAVTDYVSGQALRVALRREMQALFEDIDLFALPTTATTAPSASDAEMQTGFLDSRALDAMCRFNFLGNLTGLPAASMPVGLDPDGLPIGFQLLGDAWDEATVLAAAAHLERIGAARVERPRAYAEVLA